ncbi:MAG: DsbA family oxidoreductase [Rhodospirillaceae bacterium]
MLKIEIFSDVVCPWCLIGKRRFEQALAERPNAQVEITWRAFQLNPDLISDGIDRQQYLQQKFGGPDQAKQIYRRIEAIGAEEGIDFAFDKITRTPNTVLAHRLIRWARGHGVQDAVVEALFSAYFFDGVDIGNLENLVEIAVINGLDDEETFEYLNGPDGVREILDETRLAYNSGITGVPCFIINRQYAVSGAQEPQAFFPLFDLDQADQANLPAQ